MSATGTQAWFGAIGALLAGLIGLFKYFNYKTKRDRRALVGAAFASTVDALASDNDTRRMAGAVLLRRFFDPRTEQGAPRLPYAAETVAVIAGMLREPLPDRLQKVLADGLRSARVLRGADLQHCSLKRAYLGVRAGDRTPVDLSHADLFEADCTEASFRGANACATVFYGACAERAVFSDANLEGADFRASRLRGAHFAGAQIGGANFKGAFDIPPEVLGALDVDQVAPRGTVVAS